LIQTIGRVARNIHGKAILYADRMTNSMERAIGETKRRREKQHAYNQTHGITPRGVEKAVRDIMEGAYSEKSVRGKLFPKVAEKAKEYDTLNANALKIKLVELEKEMYQHAHQLEFEEAAKIRDLMAELQKKLIAF
jgi:excinuclease ABC subunit B